MNKRKSILDVRNPDKYVDHYPRPVRKITRKMNLRLIFADDMAHKVANFEQWKANMRVKLAPMAKHDTLTWTGNVILRPSSQFSYEHVVSINRRTYTLGDIDWHGNKVYFKRNEWVSIEGDLATWLDMDYAAGSWIMRPADLVYALTGQPPETHSGAEERLHHLIYDYNECGPWLKIIKMGEPRLILGSIVEGVDYGTEEHTLKFPFTLDQFHEVMNAIEKEAEEIWNDTHGCEQCPYNEETGYNMINPNCPNCGGEGVIL